MLHRHRRSAKKLKTTSIIWRRFHIACRLTLGIHLMILNILFLNFPRNHTRANASNVASGPRESLFHNLLLWPSQNISIFSFHFEFHLRRSLSTAQRDTQAGGTRLRTDTAVAISSRAALGFVEFRFHQVGR